MDFVDSLNSYCNKTGCTNVEIAKAASIDVSTLSRIRNRSRKLSSESDIVEKLATGLGELLSAKGEAVDVTSIVSEFTHLLEKEEYRENQAELNIINNFNLVMNELDIPNIKLAKFLAVDASLISRVRNKNRRPGNLRDFVGKFAQFLSHFYWGPSYMPVYEKLFQNDRLDEDKEELYYTSPNAFEKRMIHWMYHYTSLKEDTDKSVEHFIEKLDEFNLDEYLMAVHFNDIKIPSVPFSFPTSKHYYGIESMREATVDFLKTVALSRTIGTLTLYSDINVIKLSEDKEFSKKWMLGLAMIIKKGNHINQIHCLDRPFEEMMIGLESWLPIYMTGQVTPYYFRDKTNAVYCHTSFVAPEVAALQGECIQGKEENGMYYLTKKTEELAYYSQKSSDTLNLALPLMKVYRKGEEIEYRKELDNEIAKEGEWFNFLPAPALYTITEELLKRILDRNEMEEKTQEKIFKELRIQQERAKYAASQYQCVDVFPRISEEEFAKRPVTLQMAGLFLDGCISYTFEEYQEHIQSLDRIAKSGLLYEYRFTDKRVFNNINILVHKGQTVIVAKNKHPMINFVIKHRKLREAFENLRFTYFD